MLHSIAAPPNVAYESSWLTPEECERYERLFLTTVPLVRPAYTSRRHGNACTTPCYSYFYAQDVHGGIPDWLSEIGTRLERRLNLESGYFNCVICRLYKDGSDRIEWHTDLRRNLDEEELTIGSVSLGPQKRTFSMRRVDDPWSPKKRIAPKSSWRHWTLGRGDMMAMIGRETQAHFEHAVLPDKRALGWRINLNFRHIRDEFFEEGVYRFYRYTVHGDTHPHVDNHLEHVDETLESMPSLFPLDWIYGTRIVQPTLLLKHGRVDGGARRAIEEDNDNDNECNSEQRSQHADHGNDPVV